MAFVKDEWWITDSQGRRIGWLYPEDMEVILESFYGHRRWVLAFAQQFGYSRSAVDRWKDGKTPIPKNVAMEISMLQALKTRGVAMTEVEAPWLPTGKGAKSPEADGPADAG